MKTGWTGFLVATAMFLLTADAGAQSGSGCLSQREAIAAVQSGQAVPLSDVRSIAERAGNGEVIKADLCMRGGRLAYVLTLLRSNGRVVTAVVDASSGNLSGVR